MQRRALLLMTLLAVTPAPAFAGFEMNDNGQSIDISNMPSTPGKTITYTPSKPAGVAEPEKKEGASRPESDPAAPALQIYNERYLPDSVKKKYGIKDAWYEQGTPQPAAAQTPPQALQPADMAAPPEEQPAPAAPVTSTMPSAAVRPMQEPLLVEDAPASAPEPAAAAAEAPQVPQEEQKEPQKSASASSDPSQPYYKSVSLRDLGLVSRDSDDAEPAGAGAGKQSDGSAVATEPAAAAETVAEQAPAVAAPPAEAAQSQEAQETKIASLPPLEEPAPDVPAETSAPAPVAAAAPAPLAPASYSRVETWRARKGEPIREVLKRWSQREGKELMWASGDAPNLPKDFSYVGPLEGAVSALIQSTGVPLYTQYRSDGLTPVMMSPASTVKTETAPVAPEPAVTVDAAVAPAAAAPLTPVPAGPKRVETRWFALSGASLPEVLQVWADDEGATLIWEASRGYALKDSVSQVGHFEDAIFKALSQFNNDEMRPVGQLYADPATGKKVLLIRNDTPS